MKNEPKLTVCTCFLFIYLFILSALENADLTMWWTRDWSDRCKFASQDYRRLHSRSHGTSNSTNSDGKTHSTGVWDRVWFCVMPCNFSLLFSHCLVLSRNSPTLFPANGREGVAWRDQIVSAKALTIFALTETYTLYISMVRIINVFFCNVAFKKTLVSCGVCGAFGSNWPDLQRRGGSLQGKVCAQACRIQNPPPPPLRTSFSYPEPPSPLCAQTFRIQNPPPPFAHKLFVSSTPLPPLRTSFSYQVPPSPLCAQAFRIQYPPPPLCAQAFRI